MLIGVVYIHTYIYIYIYIYLRNCLYDGREHAMADRAAAESLLVVSPPALFGGPREARGRLRRLPRFARQGLATLGLAELLRRLSSAGYSDTSNPSGNKNTPDMLIKQASQASRLASI